MLDREQWLNEALSSAWEAWRKSNESGGEVQC